MKSSPFSLHLRLGLLLKLQPLPVSFFRERTDILYIYGEKKMGLRFTGTVHGE